MTTLDDPTPQRAGPPTTILVVEDDAGIRTALVSGLELSGYRVLAAGNGREALQRLDGLVPALIILDLHMPGMDGVTFAQELGRRNLDPTPQELGRRNLDPTPQLLVLSGDSEAQQTAERIGAARCLRKPLRFPALLEAVGALLRERLDEPRRNPPQGADPADTHRNDDRSCAVQR
jgi:CheY-like chemotaxis protein